MATPRKVACVEIGGVPIALATSDEGFFDLLRQRYDGFLSSSCPQFELEFDLTSAQLASDGDVRVRREGGEWLLQRGDFHARWDPRNGRGSVCQDANPYSLDSVLRIVHSLILAERGGFLLHSASAICDGRAYLFSGVSGAGKTTMTRLAPADITLLTDEISYVRPGDAFISSFPVQGLKPTFSQALNGTAEAVPYPKPETSPRTDGYAAFGTPFSGELAKAGENCAAPIAALFFLEQGPENRIDELPSADAVRKLMRNILFFAEDKGLVEKLFATACDFVARVPIRRLTFYPDGRVWDLVRNFDRNFHGVPQHV
jgi:hypothetical protein